MGRATSKMHWQSGVLEITSDQLTAAIQQMHADYCAGVDEALQKAEMRAAEAMVKDVRSHRSEHIGPNRGRFFSKVAARPMTQSEVWEVFGRGTSGALWYVKAPDYPLTHLLEHGHTVANQYGVTNKRTRAFNMVGNALANVTPQFDAWVKEAIESAG